MTDTLRLSLLIALSLLAAGMSAGQRCVRTHLDSTIQMTDTIVTRQLDTDDADIESVTVEARGALPRIREGRGMSDVYWGMSLTAPGDTINIALRFGNSDFGDLLDRRICVVTVTRGNKELYDKEVSGFHTGAGEYNSLTATLTDDRLIIDGGGSRSSRLCEITLDGALTPTETSVWNVGKMHLSVYSTEVCRPPHRAFASGLTRDELDRHFATSSDPVEGYWKYFDRSNDPMFARLGGRYTLAVISRSRLSGANDDGYDIIYIDGAQTLANSWSPMMLKGTLYPTIFEGHYDLHWIDSTFETITDDISATITEHSLLTLSFPLLKTTVRFSKVPTK
ncbi:MAG: hypothetical protein K2G05_08715 [Duncaniella sp.]|nr:hypothetical protein [Duncaniella sp.]